MAEDLPTRQSITGDENVQVRGDHNVITVSSSPRSRDWRRADILDQMHRRWIAGLLERSLGVATPLSLQFAADPEVIEEDEDPLPLLVQEMEPTLHLLLKGPHILQAYEQAKRQLLILGEPGSGKTTLLLELARELLQQASQDEGQPIPVVFPLSSWMTKDRRKKHLPFKKQLSFEEWLVEELHSLYSVPQKVAKKWIDDGMVLPLFDGLDEVFEKDQKDCVKAINGYRQSHRVRLVICSRRQVYLDIGMKLQLGGAIVVQPLTNQQIETYLSNAGEQSASLKKSLESNPLLRELVTNPLMLQVLVKAYRKDLLENISLGESPEAQQRELFALYVQSMLQRREVSAHYKDPQTIFWLACLARQMVHHGTEDYDLRERIWQPLDGAEPWYLWGLFGIFGVAFGLFFALHFSVFFSFLISFGLGAACIGLLVLLVRGIGWLLSLGEVGAGVIAMEWGIPYSSFPTKGPPTRSSLPRLYSSHTIEFAIYSGVATIISLAVGVIVGFGIGFLLNAVLSPFVIFAFVVVIGVIVYLIVSPLIILFYFFAIAIPIRDLFYWLRSWYFGYRPFRYKQFLDYAAGRILIYKVDNHYRFVHNLIRDYFNSLS